MEFSRQEYWSGLPCPSPGDLPNPGTEPVSLKSPAWACGFFTTSATKKYRLPGSNQGVYVGGEEMEWWLRGIQTTHRGMHLGGWSEPRSCPPDLSPGCLLCLPAYQLHLPGSATWLLPPVPGYHFSSKVVQLPLPGRHPTQHASTAVSVTSGCFHVVLSSQS